MAEYNLLIVLTLHMEFARAMTQFTKYTTTDVRLLHQYKTEECSSHLQCIIECSLDTRCLAVNYQMYLRSCELNDNNVYAINGFNSESADNWIIYTKANQSCYNGWSPHAKSCYFFSTDKVPWNDARTACQNRNSVLVEIDSANEDNFLVDRLQKLNGETGVDSHYWTSGNDFDVQFQWQWGHPGGRAIEGYTNWAVTDPNGGPSEDCIAMYGFNYFKWVDIRCGSLLYYICEISLLV